MWRSLFRSSLLSASKVTQGWPCCMMSSLWQKSNKTIFSSMPIEICGITMLWQHYILVGKSDQCRQRTPPYKVWRRHSLNLPFAWTITKPEEDTNSGMANLSRIFIYSAYRPTRDLQRSMPTRPGLAGSGMQPNPWNAPPEGELPSTIPVSETTFAVNARAADGVFGLCWSNSNSYS